MRPSLVRRHLRGSSRTRPISSAARGDSYEPPKKRSGIAPPPEATRRCGRRLRRGARSRSAANTRLATEHHNPMELHATTVVWDDDGKLTVYDKTQGVAEQPELCLPASSACRRTRCRVVDAVSSAAPSARACARSTSSSSRSWPRCSSKRSVRVVLTRQQMFTSATGPRRSTRCRSAPTPTARCTSIMHDAVAATSQFEDYQEVVVNWSGLLYRCDNVKLRLRARQARHLYARRHARAGRAARHVRARKRDGRARRTRRHRPARAAAAQLCRARRERRQAVHLARSCAPATSRARSASAGQAQIAEPRSMRDGSELIGWGMATGVWDARCMKTSRARPCCAPTASSRSSAAPPPTSAPAPTRS